MNISCLLKMQWKDFIGEKVRRMSCLDVRTQELFDRSQFLEKCVIYLKVMSETEYLNTCLFISEQNLWFLLDISPRTHNKRIDVHP